MVRYKHVHPYHPGEEVECYQYLYRFPQWQLLVVLSSLTFALILSLLFFNVSIPYKINPE